MSNKTTTKTPSTMKYLAMILALAPNAGAFHIKPMAKVPAAVRSKSFSTGAAPNPHADYESMTRLYYVSGAEQDHTTQAVGNAWWSSIFGGRESSSAADDYLEFLDKRYNSILKDGDAESSSKGFSVMDWLYSGASEDSAAQLQKQREEDALYVLGVANLASKKFLQRHRLPAPEDVPATASSQEFARTKAVFTDVEIVDNKKPQQSPPVVAAMAVLQELARRRELLLQKQTRGVRFALAYIAQSIVTGPARTFKAMHKLFVMGGGKQSLAMTVAALAACSFLLRPLIRVAAVEGVNTIRP